MNSLPGNAMARVARADARTTVFCFSHLRWDFVYQRPQHLMSRAAAHADVYYMEEPVRADVREPVLCERMRNGVCVLTPQMPDADAPEAWPAAQHELLDAWLRTRHFEHLILWYYTPMALLFSAHLHADRVVYDCMDQLSAFEGAPPELVAQEQALFARADVVFTGGRSLYEEKKDKHRNVHLFPSSVDAEHFRAGRSALPEPADLASIPRPRVGFFGVLDERLDRDLLRQIAALQPGWQFVLIGPVVKIDEHALPRAANLHYLGMKSYGELPAYLAHWDVAMLPFAQNDSTRFISPTKTPEYLAAGKPVVSTPIRDVVEPFGRMGLARIAASPAAFAEAIAELLRPLPEGWLAAVDAYLRTTSWDRTFAAMWSQILDAQAQAPAATKSIREEKEQPCSTLSS